MDSEFLKTCDQFTGSVLGGAVHVQYQLSGEFTWLNGIPSTILGMMSLQK
jgi:hypothetical protein